MDNIQDFFDKLSRKRPRSKSVDESDMYTRDKYIDYIKDKVEQFMEKQKTVRQIEKQINIWLEELNEVRKENAKTEEELRFLTQKIHDVLENFDILITPTNFDLPFNLGDISQINKHYMRHARSPFNVSGNPAISVPCGLSKTNLPIGFQIVGRQNADQFISDIAQDFLIETDWENIRKQNIIKNLFL